MSGWHATPDAASAAVFAVTSGANRRAGVYALFDLYSTANRTGYAPRPFTQEVLAEEWGCDRKVVVTILRALEAVPGLVTVTWAEPRTRKPSVVVVHDPLGRTRKAPLNMTGNKTGNKNPNKNYQPAPVVVEAHEQEPEQDREHEREQPRAEDVRARSEQTVRSDPSPSSTPEAAGPTHPEAQPSPEPAPAPTPERPPQVPPPPPTDGVEHVVAVAELVALQDREEPQHGAPRMGNADWSAVERALGRGVPAAGLRALWVFSGVSDHPLIAGCREGDWRRWKSLLKGIEGEERLRLAMAWDAAGRPGVQPRAGPAPPAARQASPAHPDLPPIKRVSPLDIPNEDPAIHAAAVAAARARRDAALAAVRKSS